MRPGGAADNSPARSAPGKWEISSRPVGALEVLTHTLKPVSNWRVTLFGRVSCGWGGSDADGVERAWHPPQRLSLSEVALVFSTAFHSRNRHRCNAQPLLGIQKAHNGFVREKSLTTLDCRDLIDHFSLPNPLSISPYFVIFCSPNRVVSERNYNKANILQKSAQESGQKLAPNSLFPSLLRASPSGSGFCRERSRSGSRNSKKTRILQSQEEKK